MKTFITITLLTFAVLTGAQLGSANGTSTSSAVITCDHYFQKEFIDGQWYLVEYDCNNSVVGIVPINE
jgi:hypothetical protein